MDNLTFLDLINIISFVVGLMNLDLNKSQNDLDNQTQELDEKLRQNVDDIHKHLEKQDKKIDYIIGVLNDDKDKRTS